MEKSLRRSVRERLRGSRRRWREYKAFRKGRYSITMNLCVAWFLFAAVSAVWRFIFDSDLHFAHTSVGMLALILFLTSRGLGGVTRLQNHLHGDTWLTFFFPIADDDLFKRQWRRYVISSLWIFFERRGICHDRVGASADGKALALGKRRRGFAMVDGSIGGDMAFDPRQT
jgi:hypothetical protein